MMLETAPADRMEYWDWVDLAMRMRETIGRPSTPITPLELIALEAVIQIERMCGSLI